MPAVSEGASARVARTLRQQWPVALICLGHWNIHWIAASLYFLIPFVREGLGLSYTEATSLISVYYLVGMAANFPGGTVVDITGRRIAVQAAVVLVAGLSLAGFGLSTSYLALAALAALIGAMNMIWHPAAISYLSIRYPARRGFAIAIHATAANVGEATAPVAAGALLLVLDWQGTAIVNGALAPLIAAALFLMLGASDRASAIAATRAAGLRGYAAGLVRLLRQGAVVTLCVLAGFRNMTQAGLVVFLPLYLADVLRLNPFLMGLTMMLMQVGGALATPLAGALSDRLGRRPLALAGLWGTTALVIALPLVGDTTVFIAGVAVLGFVMYAVRPVLQSWAMDLSPPELHGSVTSLMFGAQSGFSAAIPLIGGLIADAFGLAAVFYVLAAGVVGANFLMLLVPRAERLSPAA